MQREFLTAMFQRFQKEKVTDVYRPGLLTAVRDLIEANGGSWSETIGAIRYGQISSFVKTEDLLKDAVSKAFKSGKTSSELKEAYSKLVKSSNFIKKRFANYIKRVALPDLCDSKDVRGIMGRVFKHHPNIIRQMMIELDPDDRMIAKNLFVKMGIPLI